MANTPSATATINIPTTVARSWRAQVRDDGRMRVIQTMVDEIANTLVIDEITNTLVPDGTPLQQVQVTLEALYLMAQLKAKEQQGFDCLFERLRKAVPFPTPVAFLLSLKLTIIFEGRVYNAANSMNEYLRKISIKMIQMKDYYPSATFNSLQPNHPGQEMQDCEKNWQHYGFRQEIVNKIVDTSKIHHPVFTRRALFETVESAVKFEEGVYTAATSQADYLHKIALELLRIEVNSENSGRAASLPTSSVSNPNPPRQAEQS